MSDEILFDVTGGWGTITLNAPDRLNALSRDMCRAMAKTLAEWRADDSVHAVLVKAEGRAFSAGGDIRYLYERRKEGDIEGPMEFFATEYLNNWRVSEFPKPYVAFIDGAVMGGGVGISILGEFRVATENALFAMPECGIGLYPDVGATHMLPRLRGEVGMWLGLTGNRLNAADMVHLGIATHTVMRSSLPEIEAQLRGIEWGENPHDQVKMTLDAWHEIPPGDTPGVDHLAEINAIFSAESVKEIIERLQEKPDDWHAEQLRLMERACPLSIRVTFHAVRHGAKQTMTEALHEEYALTRRFVEEGVFLEGVRAQIIDKDRNPTWQHDSIGAVSKSEVDSMFRDAPDPIEFNWEAEP